PILSGVLCFTPIARAIGVRRLAFIASFVVFALSLIPAQEYQRHVAGMQFTEDQPWIPAFNIFYRLGMDGIALPLILLTTFTTVLVVLAEWKSITRRVEAYMASFLIMEGLMIG